MESSVLGTALKTLGKLLMGKVPLSVIKREVIYVASVKKYIERLSAILNQFIFLSELLSDI